MDVSLPEPLKQYVDEQVDAGNFGSPSEYMRELVRADQERQERTRLEKMLLESLESGEPLDVTSEMIEGKRNELLSRAKK